MQDTQLISYTDRNVGSFQDSIKVLTKTKEECNKVLDAVKLASKYAFTPETSITSNNDTNSGSGAKRPNYIDLTESEMKIATTAIKNQAPNILDDVKNLEANLFVEGNRLISKQRSTQNTTINSYLTSVIWKIRDVIMTTKELCLKLAVWDKDYLGEINPETKREKLTQKDIDNANKNKDAGKIIFENAKRTEEATIWGEMAIELSKYSIKEILKLEQIAEKATT